MPSRSTRASTPTPLADLPFERCVLPDFVRRLAALPPEAWDRLAAKVPELNGDSAKALWARAERFADGLPAPTPRLLARGLGLFHAVRSEFAPSGPPPTTRLHHGGLPPEIAVALNSLVAHARTHRPRYPGVAVALEAVAPLLMAAPNADVGAVPALYEFLDDEIPFSSLQPYLRPEAADSGDERP